MSINVGYGPIGAALGLAQVAGAGQGRSIQSQRDLEALRIQDEMQRTANQYAQSQIQDSLAYAELQQRQAAQQQTQQQQDTYRKAQLQLDQQAQAQAGQRLKQQGDQFNQEQQTREQQAKSLNELRATEQKQKADRDNWLATLTPEQRNIVLSGGHLPTPQEQAEAQRRDQAALVSESYRKAELLKDQIAMLQKQADPLNNISDDERAAVSLKLREAQNQYNLTVDGINAATGSRQVAPPPVAKQPGGIPSSALPDAEKAKLLLNVAHSMNLPPDDPRVIQAAAKLAPSFAARMAQQQVAAQAQATAYHAPTNEADIAATLDQLRQNPPQMQATAPGNNWYDKQALPISRGY